MAALGPHAPDDIEEVWHGLAPPYAELFAYATGQGAKPDTIDPTPFRTPMLAHAIDEAKDFAALQPADFMAEWKWDGIRLQAVTGLTRDAHAAHRLYSRSGVPRRSMANCW